MPFLWIEIHGIPRQCHQGSGKNALVVRGFLANHFRIGGGDDPEIFTGK